MGTSNFYNKNASKVYSILDIEDDWEYEHIKEDIKYWLEDIGFDTFDEYQKGLRSFPSRKIGGKGESKLYGDSEVFIHITAIIRSGYYEGVNLDWELEVELNGYILDDNLMWNGYNIEQLLNDRMNKGLAKINAPNVENWIWNTQDNLIDQLETIYKKATTPLDVVGTFSNGNTVYKKA